MTTLAAKIQTRIHVAKDKFTNEDGATAVEYGLMVALIAAVIVVRRQGARYQGQRGLHDRQHRHVT